MLFSSTIFIFFFLPSVLFGYYIIFKNNRRRQNLFLTLCSLFFYAWGEPWFVGIMIVSIIFNWFFALIVDKFRTNELKAKAILTTMLIFNLSILYVFKYLIFTLNIFNNITYSSVTVPKILLPIGISFFTFQAVSYVIDVYRQNGEVQKNPLNVALYIAFFPQLIAGPIVRYQTIATQINDRNETIDDFSEGVQRFIIGLAKKVILANNMAIVADTAFKAENISVSMAWLGIIAYTFQIFYDFSGYSDMAIGLGKMFGFHFLENFNYPYTSKSISEFWRRWHISLGAWFRDYVYFPLGGSRTKTKLRLVFNLFIVWFLTGFWHGANWTFITWGLLYHILIIFEKFTLFEERFLRVTYLKHIYTMFFVIIGWVIFRSTDISSAVSYISSMFWLSDNPFIDNQAVIYFSENKVFYLLSILLMGPLFSFKEVLHHKTKEVLKTILIISVFIISLSFIVKGTYNPFIYFNF